MSKFIKNLTTILSNEIENNISVSFILSLGNIEKIKIFDNNITNNDYNLIKNKFIKYDVCLKNTKHYYYKDLELISTNNHTHICFQKKKYKLL